MTHGWCLSCAGLLLQCSSHRANALLRRRRSAWGGAEFGKQHVEVSACGKLPASNRKTQQKAQTCPAVRRGQREVAHPRV